MAPEWLPSLAEFGWLRLDLLGRLGLAAVLGGVVGLEREISGKPAGLRTNLLICVGAALLTELSVAIALAADPATTTADPARIAAQIVSGIGFLGAGTILHSRGSVVGLTTAATLWVVAAVGIAVGAGAYVEAVGTTLLVVFALMLLGRVEKRFFEEPEHRTIRLDLDILPEHFAAVERLLHEAGAHLDSLELSRKRGVCRASFAMEAGRGEREEFLQRLLEETGVLGLRSG